MCVCAVCDCICVPDPDLYTEVPVYCCNLWYVFVISLLSMQKLLYGRNDALSEHQLTTKVVSKARKCVRAHHLPVNDLRFCRLCAALLLVPLSWYMVDIWSGCSNLYRCSLLSLLLLSMMNLCECILCSVHTIRRSNKDFLVVKMYYP